MTIRGTITGLALVLTTLAAIRGDALAQGVGTSAAARATGATRVRVSTNIRNMRPQGSLVFASADSLVVVDSYGNPTRILRANVTAVDTSAGRVRHTWQGLGIGLLAGGAVGMAIGFADGDDPPQFLAMSAEDKAVLAGAAFGVLGGITGLIAGSLTKTDRWQRATLDALYVTARPARGGEFSLSLSIPIGRRLVAPVPLR